MGSKLAQLYSNIAMTPAFPSVAAVLVWVSRVPHSGNEVGAEAWAFSEITRASRPRATAVTNAMMSLVARRVRWRIVRVKNAFTVLLNFQSRIMIISLCSHPVCIRSVN